MASEDPLKALVLDGREGGLSMLAEIERSGRRVEIIHGDLERVLADQRPPRADLVVLPGDGPTSLLRATAEHVRRGRRPVPLVHTGEELLAAYEGRPERLFARLRARRAGVSAGMRDRALAAASSGVLISDALEFDQPLIYASPGFERLTGYHASDLVGRNCRFLQGPETDPEPVAELREAVSERRPVNVVLLNYRADGTHFWNQVSLSPVTDDDGRVVQFVAVLSDESERLDAERRVMQLAFHDTVTGLPNRTEFLRRLETAIAAASGDGDELAVLHIDIDEFRLVNDSLGFATGDELLRLVAARLGEVICPESVLARPYGDEFLVLLPALGADPVESAEITAEALIASLAVPFFVGDAEFQIGASVGIALFPRDADDAKTLLAHADAAIHQVKERGGGEHGWHTGWARDPRERLSLATRVRRALAHGEFLLHYQPIFELPANRLSRLEALIRWNDPERGLIPPGEFIPIAEETGLIEVIGEWVLDEISRQAGAWRHAGLDARISFNLSPRQLRRPGLAAAVRSRLSRNSLEPQLFTVEITETAAMEVAERVEPVLHDLERLGVNLAIDDFGAGYSSLDRLRGLPVSVLKIDRSFMHGVPEDAGAGVILTSLIELARGLGMEAVAEGVETEAQRQFALERGCPLVQGFHLGRPLPPAEAEALLPPLREPV